MVLWKERISNITSNHVVAIVAFTIPFGILVSNISIIVYCLHTFFQRNFWTDLKETFVQRRLFFLCFALFYVLHVLGLFNTENLSEAFFDLEKKLTILLFPLVIILNRNISGTGIRNSFIAFVSGCFIQVSICLVHSFYFSFFFDTLKIENFQRENLMMPIETYMHPTDLATYSVFCLFILAIYIYLNRYNLKHIDLFLLSIISMAFIFCIFMLTSRTPIIALIVILAFLVTIVASQNFSRFVSIILMLSTLVSIASAFYFIKPIRERFNEIVLDSYELPYGAHHNSTNIRMANYVCSIQLIIQNPLIGYGTGDVQENLDNCYRSKHLSNILYRDVYNCHNQYFQTWIGLGITGIISWLLCLGIPGYFSVRKKHISYILFLILVILCSMTESFLCYQKGVVFYSFFNSILSCLFFQGENNTRFFSNRN